MKVISNFGVGVDRLDLAACARRGFSAWQVTVAGEPKSPGEEGLRDLTIMKAIYEAAKTGTTLKL